MPLQLCAGGLRKLQLDGWDLKVAEVKKIIKLCDLPALEALRIGRGARSVSVKPPSIAALAAKAPNLTILEVYPDGTDAYGLVPLLAKDQNLCSKLRKLHVSRMSYTSFAVLKQFSKLESLVVTSVSPYAFTGDIYEPRWPTILASLDVKLPSIKHLAMSFNVGYSFNQYCSAPPNPIVILGIGFL